MVCPLSMHIEGLRRCHPTMENINYKRKNYEHLRGAFDFSEMLRQNTSRNPFRNDLRNPPRDLNDASGIFVFWDASRTSSRNAPRDAFRYVSRNASRSPRTASGIAPPTTF